MKMQHAIIDNIEHVKHSTKLPTTKLIHIPTLSFILYGTPGTRLEVEFCKHIEK